MRSVEEAANATAFDGVAYKDSYLKVSLIFHCVGSQAFQSDILGIVH